MLSITKNYNPFMKQEINWQEFLSTEKVKIYDDKPLYKNIRQRKINAKCIELSKKYSLRLEYNDIITDEYYEQILQEYFGISSTKIKAYLNKLKSTNFLEWKNLSPKISNLLMLEINKFLADNKLSSITLIKRIHDNDVKKSRSYLI